MSNTNNMNIHKSEQDSVVLVAKFDYTAKDSCELNLLKNERLLLLDSSKNWWYVQKLDNNQKGYIPSNFVKKEKRSLLDKLVPKKIKRFNINYQNGSTNAEEKLDFRLTAIVKHKYQAVKNDEITLSIGMIVNIVNKFEDGWWKVDFNGLTGLYPSNYLEELVEDNTTNNLETLKADSISSTEIEYVRVLYSFNAIDKNELSVKEKEILKVIDDVDIYNNFIKVMNNKGNIGLIPSNCIQPVLDSKPNFIRFPADYGLFAHKNWYFGNITRYETNILLNTFGENGDFIVRDSERDTGNYSVSLKSSNINNKHFKIIYKNNQFLIGKKLFNTMEELIEYYKKHPIFDQGTEKLCLIKCFQPPLEFQD